MKFTPRGQNRLTWWGIINLNEKLCVTFAHLLVQKGIFLGLTLHKNAWKIFVSEPRFSYRSCTAFPGSFARFLRKRYESEKRSFIRQTTQRWSCSSSPPISPQKSEKICVNFHGLKQEQRCVLGFETCLVIWKSYLAELLFLSYPSSGFSGSFTAMRQKDIRLKKRNFICQST
jgi:hypothetical protein